MSPALSFISCALCGGKASEETGARALPALPSCEGCWAHLPGPGRNLLSSCIQLHTPPGEYMDFFSRGKHFAMLPSFSNHCALVLPLLLKEWAAGMFRGLWTQLMNGLRGRQIKSFWVEKFQFNHVFYLYLNSGTFFFYFLCSFRVWLSSQSPLQLCDTPMAQEWAGGRNCWSHITKPNPKPAHTTSPGAGGAQICSLPLHKPWLPIQQHEWSFANVWDYATDLLFVKVSF